VSEKVKTTARERELERAKRQEAADRLAYAYEVRQRLEEAGWTNVKVEFKAAFLCGSGDSPGGVNFSAAVDAGDGADEALLAVLFSSAKPVERRTAPVVFYENTQRIEPKAYERTPAPPKPPPPEPEEIPNVRDAVANLAGQLAGETPPEVSEPAPLGGFTMVSDSSPIPPALAREVPENLDLKAQKEWCGRRWLVLNAQERDEARPLADRKLPEMKPAERALLKLLNEYRGWFN